MLSGLVNEHFLWAWQQQDPEGRKKRCPLFHCYVLKALYDVKHKLMQLLLLKGIQREAARYQLKYFVEQICIVSAVQNAEIGCSPLWPCGGLREVHYRWER